MAMKVRVVLTVEVDPNDWTLAYGVRREDVREAVKQHIANGVDGASDAPITVIDWK